MVDHARLGYRTRTRQIRGAGSQAVRDCIHSAGQTDSTVLVFKFRTKGATKVTLIHAFLRFAFIMLDDPNYDNNRVQKYYRMTFFRYRG